MNIVLEGPDASGKSTLALHLSNMLRWPIVQSEGPEKYPGEINERIERYSHPFNVIFDRHPVVSQAIYSRFNGGTLPYVNMTQRFYDSQPLIIFCHRDAGIFPSSHIQKEHDTEDHMIAIKKHDGDIVRAYEEWAVARAHFIYRIGESYDRVTQFVRSMTAPNMVADIRDFHEKFGLEYNGRPRALDGDLRGFRMKFMQEELDEYVDAETLEKELDALVDLVYVALGTSYVHGFDFNEAWRRVHEANMKKVRVERLEDSVRKSKFDVVKPPGWHGPVLSDLVE